MGSSPFYAILNVAAFVVNIVVVAGSNGGWFGKDNAEVSELYPTLVTPDNYAFAIWGLIFATEAIFTIWQALPANWGKPVVTEGIVGWFAAANFLQVAWTFAFAQEQLELSAALLLAIAISLAAAVIRLASFKRDGLTILSLQYWVAHFPIALHGGWTLAASLVNINVALFDSSISAKLTALLLTLVGAALAAVFASTVFRDQVYLLAIAWAIAAVESKKDYREATLDPNTAQGINDALQGLWIALIVVAVGSVVAQRAMKRPPGAKDSSGDTEPGINPITGTAM
ncbi:unnamed protein product [Discosporangium mesarthrocarpum]